ncbi:hypothetical protein [Paracoccus sp. SMMA_5]|uniref:hypothetical protein n=1 Tax=Paracoccus sp. SMMA_5 TaxID=2654281 RepID=UPI0018A6C5C1|nr:hypothetical protein [Paracoccus sp. SMMA_5]UXU73823.1 hypothetical protein GB879_007705 [Paracoccus sp. SMMA_5]
MEDALHKSVQILIAAACVVTIAAGSIWLMDRKKQAEAIAAKEAADKARVEATLAVLERQNRSRMNAEIDACRADLEAYDSGSIIAFVQRAKGGDMLAEVNKCRDLVNR